MNQAQLAKGAPIITCRQGHTPTECDNSIVVQAGMVADERGRGPRYAVVGTCPRCGTQYWADYPVYEQTLSEALEELSA